MTGAGAPADVVSPPRSNARLGFLLDFQLSRAATAAIGSVNGR